MIKRGGVDMMLYGIRISQYLMLPHNILLEFKTTSIVSDIQ